MSGENDQVLWRGVRPVEGISGVWPARNATRLNKWALQSGAATKTIYTVAAGKTAFVTAGTFTSRLSAVGSQRGYMALLNDSSVLQYLIVQHLYETAGQLETPLSFMPALEAAAGWEIVITSLHADLDVFGSLFGWLEDA